MLQLYKNIKKLREEKEMSQQQLADMVGYKDRSMITKIEKGLVDLQQSKIMDFAKALDVPVMELMYGENLSGVKNLTPLTKIVKIPILGTIACGSPILAEENLEGYFVADPSIIKADFIVHAKGDSMIDANINDGDLVFLKKTSDADNGSIVAVLIEDEATLKRLRKTDNALILEPCNKDHSPIVYTEDDKKEVKILGEMVGVYSKRKE